MDKGERISWAIYLIIFVGLLSGILYFEYFYKIDWVNTDTFFQYSLKKNGIYVKVDNEKDLEKLFDMQSFGPFRPFNDWESILAKYGKPNTYEEEKGVEYAIYVNKGARLVYYGEHHEDRNYISLKAIFVDRTIDDFIINDELRRLIIDKSGIERIWVCKNNDTRFFCVVNYPLIEEVHWNHIRNWGIPY